MVNICLVPLSEETGLLVLPRKIAGAPSPPFSLGWRISDEAFFPDGFITNLKIRGSYGELGSQNIGNFDYREWNQY